MVKTIYSEKNEILLQWLKKERQKKGFSMRKLAEKLNRPHSFISKVEQGERRLDVIEYIDYCGALGIDPIYGIKAICSILRKDK